MTRSSGPYSIVVVGPVIFTRTALASFSFSFSFFFFRAAPPLSLSLFLSVVLSFVQSSIRLPLGPVLGLWLQLSASARASWHHRTKTSPPLEYLSKPRAFTGFQRWFQVVEVIGDPGSRIYPLSLGLGLGASIRIVRPLIIEKLINRSRGSWLLLSPSQSVDRVIALCYNTNFVFGVAVHFSTNIQKYIRAKNIKEYNLTI